MENGQRVVQMSWNIVGKGEIACYEQFLLFPVFSKDLYCRHVKYQGLFGKRLKGFGFKKARQIDDGKIWKKNFERKQENAVKQQFPLFYFNIFHSIKGNSLCFRLHLDLFVFCKYFQFRLA